MIKIIALLTLHLICLYFLWFLWKDKNKALKRGTLLTKVGLVSRGKSPRWFYISVWVDFVILLVLYAFVIAYSLVLLTTGGT
jgi:hypothetical protein